MAEEVFGYVEDEEEPLTEWYKARCQRQRTKIMEYDITTMIANILIGIGWALAWWCFGSGALCADLRMMCVALVRETIREVEAQMLGVWWKKMRTTVFLP
jgi:hypothetical protein